MIWNFPVISEIPFTIMLLFSWVMFVIAMERIRTTIYKLPNCFANERVTRTHFVVLSTQAIVATVYAIFYTVVFIDYGFIDE